MKGSSSIVQCFVFLFSLCVESTSQPKEPQTQPVKVQTKQKPAVEEIDTKVSEPEKGESEGKDDFLMNLWSTLKSLTVQVFYSILYNQYTSH